MRDLRVKDMDPFQRMAQAFEDVKSPYAAAHFNEAMDKLAALYRQLSAELEANTLAVTDTTAAPAAPKGN